MENEKNPEAENRRQPKEHRNMEWNRQTETLDDLQNGFRILQAREGFRFGIDAVLLADFAYKRIKETTQDLVPERHRQRDRKEPGPVCAERPAVQVLDLGCGNGILPLLLAARDRRQNAFELHITGLELQAESAALAKRSVAGNHLEEQITIRQGDLRNAAALFEAASFDCVISNPPYMLPSQGKVSPKESVAIARHEIFCSFADVAAAAVHALRPGGSFFLVHRSVREAEILETLQATGLAPKSLRRVQPFADREANLFLVEAVCGPARLTVEDPLVIYQAPGRYTDEVIRLYDGSYGDG